MGYRDPKSFYTAQNAQIAGRTSSSARANMAKSLDQFTRIQQARIAEVNARKKERNDQLKGASNDYSEAYRATKMAADQFAQSVQGAEGSNMAAQIKNALVQVGMQLNNNIADLGQDASQFQINQFTDDAIVQITKLKTDLTTLYEGYEEWQAQKDMGDNEIGKVLSSFNPELQNLYAKLDNDENDVILQMNPENGNWLFIPIKKGDETFKILKDDYKEVDGEIQDADGNVISEADAYKTGDALYDAVKKGAENLEYNVDNATGVIDATNLTQRASEGNMFKTVIGHKADVEGITTGINSLYESGRFRSVDDKGNTSTAPKSSKYKQKNQNKQSYLDRDMAYDYFMNDPEGISYMDTYVDNDNIDGQLQGLGINPLQTGIDKRYALRNALLEKSLLKISTPKKPGGDNATALTPVPNANAIKKP